MTFIRVFVCVSQLNCWKNRKNGTLFFIANKKRPAVLSIIRRYANGNVITARGNQKRVGGFLGVGEGVVYPHFGVIYSNLPPFLGWERGNVNMFTCNNPCLHR